MIGFLTVAIAALLVSALTLFSGFGLGTLLMPVFALFFEVETAVVATAAVHGAQNTFKIIAVGKLADKGLVLRFGLPAIAAAFAGASLLGYTAHFDEIARYSIGSTTAVITPLKLIIGTLMFIFALLELLPCFADLRFDRKYLFIGGILSGFFGGLSGHHGALRAAFLAKVEEQSETFVGTNAVISFLVDTARIATYAALFFLTDDTFRINASQWPLIATGIIAALAGVLLGKKFLPAVDMKNIQLLTGSLLLGISVALAAGVI